MKVEIASWQAELRIVRIIEESWRVSVIKYTEGPARIVLRYDDTLDTAKAKAMATALMLAAKVAGYLDDLEPDEALDAIKGMPTTPYDGWRPMPRAGRTEN